MPVMEISVVPIGTKTPSVSRYVADAVALLDREKDIHYQLTPMGTVIEADSVEKLLEIAGKMHHAVLSGEIRRIVTSIKIDERLDQQLTMQGKVDSVKARTDRRNQSPPVKD